ncbi:MAG: ACT domain-containing protein, partial [Pseudonocardiales bacterium]
MPTDAVVTLSCPDQPGIVAAVAQALAGQGGDIRDSQQFGDDRTGRFFMRVHALLPAEVPRARLRDSLQPVAEHFGMTWTVSDPALRPAVLVMASKEGHCLNDLLYRWSTGWLPVAVVGVASNHET